MQTAPSHNGEAAAPAPAPAAAPGEGLPPGRAWFVAFMGVVLLAGFTFVSAGVVRRVKLGQVDNRLAVIKGDEVFADAEALLDKLAKAIAGYERIIGEGTGLRVQRDRLLLRQTQAEKELEDFRKRADVTPAQREAILVQMERRLAGIQIDLNTNKGSQLRIPTAEKNKTLACEQMQGLVPKVKNPDRKRRWAAWVGATCAGRR